jgi:hypothetical protein
MMNFEQGCTRFLTELQKLGANPRNVDNLEVIMKKAAAIIAKSVDSKYISEFSKFCDTATNFELGEGEDGEVVSTISLLHDQVKRKKIPAIIKQVQKKGIDAYFKKLVDDSENPPGFLKRLFGG